MNRFTQIFNTPYVPKYGSMPISEVGKIMQQRKQSMDNAVLQDMQTMSVYNKTMSMLDEDERLSLNQAIGQPLIDVKARIESGDYNIRDIALQPRKDAIKITGLVETALALAQQRQEDYENFIELNKDADPEQVAEIASQNRAKLQLDDDGYLTLIGGLGDTKLSDYVPEGEKMVVEPIQFGTSLSESLKRLDELRKVGIVYKKPSKTSSRGYTLSTSSTGPSNFYREDYNKKVPVRASNIQEAIDNMQEGEYKLLFEKVASSLSGKFTNDFDKDESILKDAIKNYFENTQQLEGVTYRDLDDDKAKKVRDRFIDDKGIVDYSIFVPEDNWRGDYTAFKNKYGITNLETADIAIRGSIDDITGFYATGGSGYVGSFEKTKGRNKTKQFIIDPQPFNKSANLEPMRKLADPFYMRDVNATATDNKTGKPVNATISKNINFYSNGEKVSGDNPYAVPRITYNVTIPEKGTKIYTLEEIYNQFFKPEEIDKYE